ncbi:MAG: SulP family inorganic anion transporter, partial [Fimbriimonas sp.]
TVAMLAAIESLLSAVVADRMTGDRHNPNVELFAQGVANIFSPLVGGLPATGAIARTATNIRSGAKTPVAGMIHALVLLLILLCAAPLAKHIPLAVLAAILMVVAYNMGEWKEIPAIFSQGYSDVAVWAITFGLTVFADLTVAVEAGMILAALIYIRRVAITSTVSRVTPDYIASGHAHSLQSHEIPEGVAAYRVHGPFLFGVTDKLELIEDELAELPPIVMLRLRNMTAIDGTGVSALEHLAHKVIDSGRTLLVCGIREQPNRLLRKSGFDTLIGTSNYVPTFADAVARARELRPR